MSDWTTDTQPGLLRIAAVTTATPDMAASERAYCDYMGYRVVERSTVPQSLAESWDAPAAAGAAMVTLAPEGETDVFARLVETPAPPGYRPLTTFGWNAFEIIVDDVHTLAEKLTDSPFEIIGPPRPLQFMPSIVAMQVRGPANECLYFTMESGDRESSILPPPAGFVGRTFIVVVAGRNFDALLRWYVDKFELRERPVRQSKVAVIQAAQGLSPDQTVELSAIGMRQRGNLVELDAYPTGPGFPAAERPVIAGHLPPGNAVATFEVESIDPFAAEAIRSPGTRDEAVYRGRRSCVLRGPAGELVELIEVR
ncbi:VOC family protein [Stakelama tenebrarum]|uniref:VOC family protein n=1 Tax=Stakelama tenebrarum TaxID=2711215 RepID=A0A6G6Y1S3_9SPHN|nr:VOC family protein [Sphingosinithalassobacter tenebrarum]QIG78849.1 VOC family protein [Sphingosinithalassobacter tenebrarum]